GRHGRFRRVATRCIGASDPRFALLFDVGRETSRAATHVDARDGVLSDAGSIPAASTILKLLKMNDLISRSFSVYLICTELAVRCAHAARNLSSPRRGLQTLRQAAPRFPQPEMHVPVVGPGFARR